MRRGPRYRRREPGRRPPRQAGFTLIELAVVVAIIGFLLGAFLVPLSTQVQANRIRDTQRALEEIRAALVGFAVVEGRLPCPDDPDDGVSGVEADCSAETADTVAGVLPWVTLGVRATDAWGRVFYYEVQHEFTGTAVTGSPCEDDNNVLELCDVADITVSTRGDDPATTGVVETKSLIELTASAPAVVLSVGPNGNGGRDLDGNPSSSTTVGTDEDDNVDLIDGDGDTANDIDDDGNPGDPDAVDRGYVSRTLTRGAENCGDAAGTEAVPFCEFDDIVVWISAPALFEKLVAARVLP